MVWVVNATPRSLYPRERLGTNCIGCWVGPRVAQDGCWKSRPPQRDLIPRPSICTRQSVTVPVINCGTRMRCGEHHATAAVLSDIWRRFSRRCSLYHQRRPYRPPLTPHPITEDTNNSGVTQILFVIILENNQLDAQICHARVFLFSTCFGQPCAHHRKNYCINAISGLCHSV